MNHRDTPFEGPDEADRDLLDDDSSPTRRCPACGAEVYEDAERCPACGEYLAAEAPHAWAGRSWWWLLLALAGIAAFVLVFAL
jgi:predicted nucleic acid-binding Zn ribbon protein